MRLTRLSICVAAAAVLIQGADAQPRNLTFEQRLRAQESIERVYYSHQIGATRPFEEAVPRAILESKVRTYLKQSVALEAFWKTPVTSEMLHRELERMAAQTRMPDRLRDLYAALGNDPLLIQECLARPALVDRLARGFFAFDATLHSETRQAAETLHEELVSGRLDPRSGHPGRSVVELVRVDVADRKNDRSRLELLSDDFDRQGAALPARVGETGPVQDEGEAFVTRVVLERTRDDVKVATFVTPKLSWDEWWGVVAGRLEEAAVEAAAPSDVPPPRTDPDGSTVPATGCDNWDIGSMGGQYVPTARNEHTAVWTGSLMLVWGGFSQNYVNSGGRYDPATDTWTPMSEINAPSARAVHTAVWTGSLMVVWGGHFAGSPLDTGGRYDPATDTWTPTSAAGAPSGRWQHTAVWTGNLMVVWGGYNGSSALNSGGRYDPATDSWTPTSTASAPPAWSGHTAVWTGSLMLVWGDLNAGGRYDPTTDTWTPISTTNAPSGRADHTAVWTGTLMILWGGNDFDGPPFLNTGGRYDPVSDSWTPISTANSPSGRFWHIAVWAGNRMVVWGGYDGSYPGTGGLYDPVADTWTPTATANAPLGRKLHTAVWTGSLVIVWGGFSDVSHFDTGGRYDPAADIWTPTTATTPAASEGGQTATWTGNLMVVWGGSRAGVAKQTGGRYDPATDTWTTVSMISAPSARAFHSAVWTGSAMIVWGGGGAGSTGGRYDPIADVWTPTSTSNAPPGRFFHTAIWTGSRMIIWGGYNGSSPLNSGGRYDPATDSWASTSMIGAPSFRYHHTAVWTGSRMVVWGGYNDSSSLNSGGRYDPSADSWTPTSAASAPTIRYDHTAVWTGNLMVVWGGNVWDSRTGGRYNPVTDTWTPTSTTNAPAARTLHTAVWTGALMVVWGGTGGGQTGGRYHVATDTWTPTTTTNAPSARHFHSAVWTGALMIVWGGGGGGGGAADTGGRYMLTDSSLDDDGDGLDECLGDCDDNDAASYPGAAEICDGADNNCDGSVDGFATSCGVGECARTGFCAAGADSCFPGAPSPEACNGEDDDCDGAIDDNLGVITCTLGACTRTVDACVNGHPSTCTITPTPEVCDGLDNDCDGNVDGFTTFCGIGQCATTGTCTAGVNSCVPGLPSVELCDGLDNDCDGVIDNALAPAASPTVTIDSTGGASVLGWTPLPDATGYDVVLGDLITLHSTGGDFTAAIQGCLEGNFGGGALTLIDNPPVGAGFFYLVRGMNCGGSGTYDSGDPAQVGSRDAEIAASPLSCPDLPVCGDGVCEGAEDCNTCYDDCASTCCIFCGPD